ncbi:cysteine--tRNA ligase [Candidatus Woesebacteria bacterium]|nr:cysteine--tRNA ligase [Candidatus Woesebacteria bacterium]
MKLYNSLTRQVEEIAPRNAGKIGMYTCGPTVYSTATIGNFRTYTLSDILARSLRYLGYDVTHVMNLTDVGHLTGDNEGDADTGEDRLEKASKKEGRTAWDIAKGYGDEFMEHLKLMNIEIPNVVCKATEHIPEQIEMVEKLETKGFTYKISDGIYFDTVKFESMGFKYGELSTLDQIQAGARVEFNPEKKDPRDFALWKFSPSDGTKRQMEWQSPWGVGFPGWHIECSAMSTKYLGDQFDIHVGGEDLRSTHHPNEIAQAEGATGKHPFVTTWVHGAFLLVDGGRMGKSLGNAYTVADIIAKGFDPLALRYFYMTGHYRRQINFTWESLKASSTALSKLRDAYQSAKRDQSERTNLSQEKMDKIETYQNDFTSAIENDLNMSEALSSVWEVVKSNIPNYDKVDLLSQFDRVLGLNLDKEVMMNTGDEIPEQVQKLIEQREAVRKMRNYVEADKIRLDIEKLGYHLEDKGGRTRAIKIEQ